MTTKTSFTSGPALTYGQLAALPDDSVVWVRYRKAGETGFRINQAAKLQSDGDGVWLFNDVKSGLLVADMTRETEARHDSPAIEYCRGEFEVFAALPAKQKLAAAPRRARP